MLNTCTAALNIRGEHFQCEDVDGHAVGLDFTAHRNSKAEAVWGEPGSPDPLIVVDAHDPEDSDVRFEDVVDVVNAYAETEGIVVEGWLLVVEHSQSRTVWNSSTRPIVGVYGSSDVTDPHAVGMLDYAADRVRATGVEG